MFKILSKSAYEKLVAATKQETDNQIIEKIRKEHRKEIESYVRQCENTERDMAYLRQDNGIALKRKDDEVAGLIQKATETLKDTITELTIDKNNAEKEVSILTKAFENLGFDVKDMRGILDKLVDGLIAKNEIKLVK